MNITALQQVYIEQRIYEELFVEDLQRGALQGASIMPIWNWLGFV
jgi:hypothetical protein